MRVGELHRYWYIALQDGRYDDIDHTTLAKADAAFNALPDFIRRSACVKSYDKVVTE